MQPEFTIVEKPATMEDTPDGTMVSGFMIWTSKTAAQEYAAMMGWQKKDVRRAYMKIWGFRGYIIGQMVSDDTFRGFATSDGTYTFAEAKVERQYTKTDDGAYVYPR